MGDTDCVCTYHSMLSIPTDTAYVADYPADT